MHLLVLKPVFKVVCHLVLCTGSLNNIGLALNVTVTEFEDTVCSRHILACMTPSYILELFHVRKTIQIKIVKDE